MTDTTFATPPSDEISAQLAGDGVPFERAASTPLPGAPPATPRSPYPRQFAGLPLPLVGIIVALFALAVWNIWTTHELVRLKSHRMVSVSLERLVRDFVATEARNGVDSDRTPIMTKLYLAATESAVKDLTRGGTTVLISEAVMGQSVPDVTSEVQATVAQKMQQVMALAGAQAPAPSSLNTASGIMSAVGDLLPHAASAPASAPTAGPDLTPLK